MGASHALSVASSGRLGSWRCRGGRSKPVWASLTNGAACFLLEIPWADFGLTSVRGLSSFVVSHGRTAGAYASCWYQPTHGRNDDSQAHHRNRSSPPRPDGRVFGSRPFRETPGEARMPDPDSFNGPLLRRQPCKTGNRLSGRSIATGLMPRSDTALTFRLTYGFRESPFRAVPLLRLDTRIVLFGVPLRSIVFRSVSARPGRWVVAGTNRESGSRQDAAGGYGLRRGRAIRWRRSDS